MYRLLALLVATACGRVGFDAVADAGLAGRWAQLAVGSLSTCAITTTHELWCWGYGAYGALGIGTLPATSPPTKVSDGWAQVAVASDHACGVKTDGSLWCWGANEHGQLGDNMAEFQAPAPVRVAPEIAWAAAAVGYQFSCALDAGQELYCWGRSDLGQTAGGHFVQANVPLFVPGSWMGLVTGDAHGCAIDTSDGVARCWGQNGSRQLGDGTTAMFQPAPVAVAGGHAFTQLAAGSSFTCGLEADGAAWCWGDGEVGQLGTGTSNGAGAPLRQTGPALAAIALGAQHGCGIARAGGLVCWGAGQRGALAGMEALAVRDPVQLDTTSVAVAAGGSTTCVLDAAARLACTGANGSGQTGQPAGEVAALVQSDARRDWRAIFAHRSHACGIHADGTTACWGYGHEGQLGDGTYFDRQVPVDVPLAGITELAMNETSTVAVAPTNAEYRWGYDFVADRYEPTPVIYGGATSVALGDAHRCVVAGTTIACAGDNAAGQLGDGTNTASTGTQVIGGHAWSTVRASAATTCGVQTDGQLFCWGDSAAGQVGAGMFNVTSVPQAVMVTVPMPSVTLGQNFACGITPSTDLWCWGANDRGQLGTITAGNSSVPLRIGSGWLAVAAGDWHACAIRTDHTLWCWGHSDEGQLGDGGLVDRPQPQQVGTGTSWSAVAAGDHFTCALAQDGTRWCFGANDGGALGNGASWLTSFTAVP